MNTLSANACFLKLKIDSPLVSNLFKTVTLLPHREAIPENLFSLILKLILNKFDNSVILQVESDGLNCVFVNPIMLVFIILLSLNISSACLASDLTF